MNWFAYAGAVPVHVVVFSAGVLVNSAVVVVLAGCGALVRLVLRAQRDCAVKAPPVDLSPAGDGAIRRAA